ncbi:MAG: AbrB/MazE/SpoVT family DNA-binding domain-containing protein [Gemmatimonadota bacterium]|nr:AbrB/MazE/SpoVT family DNA-binding domain-containing protein [Gemmatimonadota bacterium]
MTDANVVTVSPKFQVVIPRAIRESLGLRPGQKVQALQYRDRVELVPVRPVKSMRGFLREGGTSGQDPAAGSPGVR